MNHVRFRDSNQVMPGKVIILSGAPEASTLDWDTEKLLQDAQQPFTRSMDGATSRPIPTSTALSNPQYPAWRELSLNKGHLPSGFSQQPGVEYAPLLKGSQHFFNTSFTSLADNEDCDTTTRTELLSQFYEHSLAVHGGTEESSLLIPDSSSFSTAAPSQDVTAPDPIGDLASGHLSDLEDIPQASYLSRIQPQTMTVNLIVGIISISPPRTVRTRWGSSKSLLEVLVGDETRAGFAVTFWLPSADVKDTVLAGLRVQDIVLLQNVALNAFQGKVYGSNLRRDMTTVYLLYRARLDAEDVGGHYAAADLTSARSAHPQLDKTRKVRDWVLRFVGGGGPKAKVRSWDRPPDDTQ